MKNTDVCVVDVRATSCSFGGRQEQMIELLPRLLGPVAQVRVGV